MSAFIGERALRSHSFELPLPMPEAFRFFEPEGERAWAPGWNPAYVYPASGAPEKGMVQREDTRRRQREHVEVRVLDIRMKIRCRAADDVPHIE